jgi:uncharacterized protein YqgV (UPF0045/DUF77 family)
MLVAISISPSGRPHDPVDPDTEEADGGVSRVVADIVRVIRDSGLPNETNAMFTNIEGEWDEVMAVVKQAVDVAAARVARRARRQRERQQVARTARAQAHSRDPRASRAGRVSVRIYVPTTLTGLAGFVGDGGVGPTPIKARAVTEWLREAWPEADEEEWEYAALSAAADDSAALLTDEDPPRRVVVVAEVDSVVESEDSSLVDVDYAFPMRLVRAVHADSEDIELGSSYDPGDLGWYAVQEIPGLLPE